MKLRITIDGKIYEAEVEIVDEPDTEPPLPPYVPAARSHVPMSPPVVPGREARQADDDKICRSPVNGLVISILVEPGQAVERGAVLMVLESMKMEMQITAKYEGVVKRVQVDCGRPVKLHQELVEFE